MNLDIETIKENFQEKELFDEEQIKTIKEMRIQAGLDRIKLAKLFISSYDMLYDNLSILDEDTQKNLKNFLKRYRDSADTLRFLLESYGDGGQIGSYYAGESIKKSVGVQRELLNELVIVFSRIFLGEEE